MKNGTAVHEFEAAFADYCGAAHCIAAANGTVTLQAALVALGVKPGDRVATTPLTMAATTIAILNVGAAPVYHDVDEGTWLIPFPGFGYGVPVSLYGLNNHAFGHGMVDDAAQTLRKHAAANSFTSYSFQASKILALGEGGALVTNDADLAEAARSYLSLGYRMNGQARIDPESIKSPTAERHVRHPSINGRMNDLTAAEGFRRLKGCNGDWGVESRLAIRLISAQHYRDAIAGCEWMTPQFTPHGWTHDMWAYAVACDTPQRALALQAKVRELGAEVPYGCWRITYKEPALRHLNPNINSARVSTVGAANARYEEHSPCPIAESLQPRILAFQCNNLASAEKNAKALRLAISDLNMLH